MGGRSPVRRRTCGTDGGNCLCLLRWLSVCLVPLDKNHTGSGGTRGIHRAILMNCAAQASLKSASEADFSLPIRCGFYQVGLRRSLCLLKRHRQFPPSVPQVPLRTGWVPPVGSDGWLSRKVLRERRIEMDMRYGLSAG